MTEVHLGSIEHLDFDVEEDSEKDKEHYGHPTIRNRHWCGRKSKPIPFSEYKVIGVGGITCVDCLHLYIDKGPDWWWRVHNAWYESSCTNAHHNCGA